MTSSTWGKDRLHRYTKLQRTTAFASIFSSSMPKWRIAMIFLNFIFCCGSFLSSSLQFKLSRAISVSAFSYASRTVQCTNRLVGYNNPRRDTLTFMASTSMSTHYCNNSGHGAENVHNLPSVGTFLRQVRQQVVSGTGSSSSSSPPSFEPHFILGNPAGDADSIISAICLAYVESTMMVMATTATSQRNTLNNIPVVSIPIQDLKTQRPETSFLLKDCANIDIDDLIAIDQLEESFSSPSSSMPVSSPTVTLVDHNRHVYSNFDQSSSSSSSNKKNEEFMSQWVVTEIVDHHLDEGSHLDTCSSSIEKDDGDTISGSGKRRVIAFDETTQKATVASTCTLIVEKLMDIIDDSTKTTIVVEAKEDAKPAFSIPPSLSILLLGVILIDSVNMIPAAGKGTPRDKAAIDFLLKNTDWSTIDPPLPKDITVTSSSNKNNPDPTKLFEALQSQKFSPTFWNGLSVPNSLRMDYKSFQIENGTTNVITSKTGQQRYDSFGISTILLDMETFWKKDDLVPSLSSYLVDNKLPLLGLMFSFEKGDGDFQRQLALVSHDDDLIDRLVAFLTEEGTTACDLLKLDISTMNKTSTDTPGLCIVKVDQTNKAASRKQVAPIFMDFWQSEHCSAR